MTNPNELAGVFWLPEHSDKRVAGHLHFADGKIRLELHDGLPGFQGTLGVSYALIFGLVGSSKYLTLARAYTNGAQLGELVQQRIAIGMAFIGAQFSEDELSFSELNFGTDHLADWAAQTGIVETSPPPPDFKWQVGFRPPEPVVADLGDGGIIKVAYEGSKRGQPGSVELSESPRIVATPTHPVDHWHLFSEFMFPVRDLLTFATMSPARIEVVVVNSPHATRPLSSGAVHQIDIEVRHTLLQPEDRDRVVDRIYPTRMLFALADWPHDFSTLIANWIRVRTLHESSMNLLMGLAYAPPRWVPTRVMMLAQALEAYHRTAFTQSPHTASAIEQNSRVRQTVKPVLSKEDWKWLTMHLQHADDPSLRERLHECASRVAAIIDPMVSDLDGFSKSLAEVRNDYSHFGAGGADDEQTRRDHVLERRAYWVLVTNYLLDLGFTPDQSRLLIARNRVFELDRNPEWIEL